MKLRRHYLTLRHSFPHVQEETPLEVTVEELAMPVDCTPRNMVLLLKRMQQEGWISWTPRKGRGNRSTLLFLARRDHIALLEAQELVAKQDLQAALALIQSMEQAASLKEQFQEWLSGRFGFHSELQGKRRTDTLRFPLQQTIHTLDPAAIHYAGESHLVNQLFDGLVRMDPKGASIQPHLAHAWDIDPTRTKWTFYLRKGVMFHHGREMRSSDVKYSLERLKRLASRGLYSWVYAGITSIESPDDTTIHIHLAEPDETFLAFLTTNRAAIVPQDACETDGAQFGITPVGTGPFRLADQQQGVWILEAFDRYFQGRGFLDRVEVWSLPEASASEAASPLPPFQVMHNVRLTDQSAGGWQQIRQSGMTCKFMTVNESKDGPLRDIAVREAIDYAIDRHHLVDLLSGDVIEEGSSFWPQYDDLAERYRSPGSPNEAASKLEAAGYRGETLILATIPQYEADARLIQQVCAASGIALSVNLIPAEQFKGQDRMTADLLLFAIMLDEHRELRLIDLFKSMQQHGRSDMRESLEHSIRLLLSEPDVRRRTEILYKIERLLMDRHSLLFLYRKHLKTAFHPSIRGISFESLGWVRFKDLWFT
ncbi:ABC transporter substrate-binding protein [Paenibacillus spongiae]|uniref:ABC transporter substrate-binding protein n=1 Tax=Paenibacillus spongiae TaxID=2909671 RepID=A0ABY5SF68_9BACL|nr:ABC transporter substrate-binding protein [Paenibacillus spongiae]UVI32634.1 ABC transporter substrate-binding protein [Paenibacillus spongiae]